MALHRAPVGDSKHKGFTNFLRKSRLRERLVSQSSMMTPLAAREPRGEQLAANSDVNEKCSRGHGQKIGVGEQRTRCNKHHSSRQKDGTEGTTPRSHDERRKRR
jgi:hypothetical protein